MSAAEPTAGERRRGRRLVAGLCLVLAGYLALALPVVERQGINWDEQTDLEIAASYLGSRWALVSGSRIDVINVRLPSFSVAFLDRLGIPLELRNARWVSCAVGVLAIVAIALFGRAALDDRKALLAAAIVATSPYFVAFSVLAFTEGDVFVACGTAWVLLTAEWLRQSPTRLRSCALGLALGSALSAKVSAAAVVAAVALAVLLPDAFRSRPARWRDALREAAPWLGAALAFAAWLVLQAVATGAAFPELQGSLPVAVGSPGRRLLLVAALWSALVAWAAWGSRIPSATARLAHPLLLAGATFFVLPPVHTTNPAIFHGLVRTSLETGGSVAPGFSLEAAALHAAVVLFKPGIVVGSLLWLGSARAALQARRRPELRLPLAICALYVAFLLGLPWAQTRYMMPVFPLMAIFAADALVDLAKVHRRLAISLVLLAAGSLVWDYRLCYPDPSLNGYQWVGARYWAGRSTLGYRSIAQMGSDGVEQILRWTAAHAEPGARVVSYVPRHHTRAFLAGAPLEVVDGNSDPAALERADYVLSSLNDEVRSGDGGDDPTGEVFQYPRYDRAILERDFQKVFAVRRAFDIEVASVWRRRERPRAPQGRR